MAIYTPITNVMPLASMVTNAVVGASLGDQIRDNLVALYDGWWFRAQRSTTQTITSTSTVILTSIAQSATSLAEGSITLDTTTGIVTLKKTGLWLVGGQAGLTAATASTLNILHSDWPVYSAEYVNDDSGGAATIALHTSGVVEQTSATASLSMLASVSIADPTQRLCLLWAVWLGERP